MYSYEERIRAVELYIKYDLGLADVVRELGYPKAKKSVKNWYEEYLVEQETGIKHDAFRKVQKYSPEENKQLLITTLSMGNRSLER